MIDLLNFLIKGLVEHPEEVEITEATTEFGFTNFSVKAAQSDLGQIIGRQGKIIKALRTLLKVAALKEGKKANLTLLDQQPLV